MVMLQARHRKTGQVLVTRKWTNGAIEDLQAALDTYCQYYHIRPSYDCNRDVFWFRFVE
jgi:hypothetical protein